MSPDAMALLGWYSLKVLDQSRLRRGSGIVMIPIASWSQVPCLIRFALAKTEAESLVAGSGGKPNVRFRSVEMAGDH